MAKYILTLEIGAIGGLIGGILLVGYAQGRDPEWGHKLVDRWHEVYKSSKKEMDENLNQDK
jgi:hypothetical protein